MIVALFWTKPTPFSGKKEKKKKKKKTKKKKENEGSAN
jgi:hypothetical protein